MNKKILFLLFALLSSLGVAAQEYFPEGTTWTWGALSWGEPMGNLYSCMVEGDTIINDKAYKLVYRCDEDGRMTANTTGDGYAYALHEENNKVWVYYYDLYHEGPDEEILYYDFQWEEGKNVVYYFWKDYEDRDEDPMTPNVPAENIQQIQLNDGNTYETFTFLGYKVINGIGILNSSGGLFPRYMSEPLNGSKYFLTSFVRNGVEIYADHRADIDGIQQVSEAVDTPANYMYDLQGRQINESTLPKGVYIYKGKKVIK